MAQIHELLGKIMNEVSFVNKSDTNKAQNYKFRPIEGVYNSVHQALAKYGVVCAPKVLTVRTEPERKTSTNNILITRMVEVEYRFIAPDGSSEFVVTWGEGSDTTDKSTNKAMAAAHKYALTQLLVLPYAEITDGDRTGEESVETVKPESKGRVSKKDELKTLMSERGITFDEIAKLAKSAGVNDLVKANEADYAKVIDFVNTLPATK